MYRSVVIILLFASLRVHAQQHRVKGILLNENTAEAVAGAKIYSRFDSSVSKKDGQFTLLFTGKNNYLEVVDPGYKVKTVFPGRDEFFFPLFLTPSPAFSAVHTDTSAFSLRHSDTLMMDQAIKAYRNETYKKEKENPFIKTGQYPYVALTLSSGYASYNNIRRFLLRDDEVPVAAVRIGEMLNYFPLDDSIPVRYPKHPLQAYADISTCPWNKAHRLMRIAVQSEKKSIRSREPRNIVLLIDVSGSMHSGDKLPLLKLALKQLVACLHARDTLAIVTYTGKSRLTLPPTPGEEKIKMLEIIDQLHAGGTTAGSKGIEKAFNLAKKHFIPGGNNRVILATDGDFNVGESSDAEMKKLILKFHTWHIGLTCIGVGSGNYKDSKLETISKWGQGTFAYIDNKAAALHLFDPNHFQKMPVVARDVRLKVLFDPGRISAFRVLGYDASGKNAKNAFVKKMHVPGGEIGINQRMTAYIELVPAAKPESEDLPFMLLLQYKSMPDRKEYLQTFRSPGKVAAFGEKNADWRFGASIVLFGMLLQHSDYIESGNYQMMEKIAKKAKDAVPQEQYKSYKRLLKKGKKGMD